MLQFFNFYSNITSFYRSISNLFIIMVIIASIFFHY